VTAPVLGSRVAIVGGSIAGCAAAIALHRAGCEVTIYERSHHDLRDRGYGIGIPLPPRERLVAAGYLDPDTPALTCDERLWLVQDASDFGRVAWRQPFPTTLNNWGVLWRALRAHVPDRSYRDATTVTELRPDRAGVEVVTASGADRFDVVIGADGYRSMTRQLVDVTVRPRYAGYSLWRGNYPEGRLPTPVPPELERNAMTVCFPHGHAVFYLIPDFDGGRRMNWAVYLAIPGARRFRDPTSVPPGSVGVELLAHLDRVLRYFPDYWAEVVRASEPAELSLQPVYDATPGSYVTDRLLLIGDAAALARPHTGSGATKAFQDALALERLSVAHNSWDHVLAGYDRERRPEGEALVELGRRLGDAQVRHTPPWQTMSPTDFAATATGRAHPYDT
jgi:2-polyprenyl-6-methoxyphenol hydroxylase-like FAD-dependent oxidoreductase